MIPDFKMDSWWQYLVCVIAFIVGIVFLVKGSDVMVLGSSSIAKKFKISPLIIGLTVVALGTSLPELAVSISDSINALIKGGNSEIAIGNVVGSNICNILIVLGICALFTPILINKKLLKFEIPFLFIVSGLFLLFALCFPFQPYTILRWEGAIFIVLIIAYVTFLIVRAKKDKKALELSRAKDNIKEYSTIRSIIYTIAGLVAVFVGGEATVYGAKNIAIGIGTASGVNPDLMSSLVGLTVVAVGTSLPELVTSAVASKKGQNDMALGNVIGSNIFNILFIIGLCSIVCPLVSGSQLLVDLIVMIGAVVVLIIFAFVGKINRITGIFFLALYGGYLSYLIVRTIQSAGA